MLGGAYSSQFKNIERQQLDTIKTLAENEKTDQIARAKKLSYETNKRRRALALKRKSDAEREEKRRQQILAKRREKQKEATERFQRAHMPPRPNSGTSSPGRWSPRRNIHLEEALGIVRGTSTVRVSSARNHDRTSPTRTSLYRQNSDPLSKPYFNKYAHPTINQNHNGVDKREELHNKSLHNLNASRTLFEEQLKTHQQLLLEQQQNALKEFNKQVMREVELDKNVVNVEHNGNGNFERSESLSSVDSLEDTVSNDTVRESCDINAFENNKGNSFIQNNDVSNNTLARVPQTNHTAGYTYNPSPNTPQNIDSYSAQIQAYNTNDNVSNTRPADKQTFHQQRQLEIQQQINEQRQQHLLQQQRQQQERQQRLDQQQKQQQLLHEEFQRQQQQQGQGHEVSRSERVPTSHQHNTSANNIQSTPSLDEEKENHRPKVQLKAWATPSPQPPTPVSANITNYSPQVTNASPYSARATNTNMTTVTPYDKSTLRTNGHAGTKTVASTTTIQNVTPPPSRMTTQSTRTVDMPSPSATNTTPVGNHNDQTQTTPTKQLTSQGSFLETMTNNLSKQQSNNNNELPTKVSNNTSNTSVPSGVKSQKPAAQQNSSNGTSSNQTTPKTNSAAAKPPVNPGFYLNSYSSAYAHRQNLQNQQQQRQNNTNTQVQDLTQTAPVTTVDASRLKLGNGGPHAVDDNHISLFQTDIPNGDQDTADTDSVSTIACEEKEPEPKDIPNGDQDTADTDSVSTIACEEKEPEPKEIKSILKRNNKTILKKSGSTGNIHKHDIRDSLEITRVHLQTSAEEKEQRMLRELERSKTDVVVTKKNVRFADLTYDDPPESDNTQDDSKLFIKRNEPQNSTKTAQQRPVSAVSIKSVQPKVEHKPPRASSATVRASSIPRAKTQIVRPQAGAHIIHRKYGETQNSTKTAQQRPVSAVSIKSVQPKVEHKPPRASSATVRASSIPRAKTQIVRPQAAAHIIHSPPSTNGVQTSDKKVVIVNNNFMEKIPSTTRVTQPVHTASPSMVYTVNSRPDQQKANYAVSSIVMPKTQTAPFIYPGFTKEALQPYTSSQMPAQNGTYPKHEGAVYDENGLRIDRTPTDEEINFLWDKVRTCLSRNSNNPNEKVQNSVVNEGHRQTAPVSNTYIDGNALGQFNSMNRVAAPHYGSNPTLNRQNSLDGANGSYTKRFGLLQQRKQQPNPNSLKSRPQQQQPQQQGYTVYHAPVQSYNEPVQTVQINGDVTESMAEFLTAEQLSEQSVSESKVHQAMDEALIRQQAVNGAKPPPQKVRSALSMEEQRLLESLDRLNDKLKVSEHVTQNSPHQQPQTNIQPQQTSQQALHEQSENEETKQKSVSGFKGHQPLQSQRRVIEAANPRARLRITSATLKKHLHRHQ